MFKMGVNTKMFHVYSVHYYFIFLAISVVHVSTNCPSISGGTAEWWILYQLKSQPYTHYYVDGNNPNNISLHFPESSDSVLSLAVKKITNGDFNHYIAYINDFLNFQNLETNLKLPVHLKLIHGLLASNSAWTSGFWILHNNLYFPMFTNDDFVNTESSSWFSSTVGDSSGTVFYTCISAGNETEMRGILMNILAGNPTIYRISHREIYSTPIFKESRLHGSSFHLEGAALMFMRCMYAGEKDTRVNCLYRFSTNGHNGSTVSVFTRTRGMLRGNRGFCYNVHSVPSLEFVSVTHTGDDEVGLFDTDNIFVLTDDPSSNVYGTTCFGQDIAAYTEVVTLMICLKLPSLHKSLSKASMMTSRICHGSYDTLRAPKSPERSSSVLKTSQIKTGLNANMTVNSKTQKESTTVKDKKAEEKLKQKGVVRVDTDPDIQKYVLGNRNSIVALFCRRSCRFCQPVQNIWHTFMKDVYPIDFLIIDIELPTLPKFLQVPHTPFIRFKIRDSEVWRDFSENEFNAITIATFIHANVFRKDELSKTSRKTNSSTYHANRRSKRSQVMQLTGARNTGKDGQNKNINKETKLRSGKKRYRMKRDLDASFEAKHIAFVKPNKKITYKLLFGRVPPSARNQKTRNKHTFIITSENKKADFKTELNDILRKKIVNECKAVRKDLTKAELIALNGSTHAPLFKRQTTIKKTCQVKGKGEVKIEEDIFDYYECKISLNEFKSNPCRLAEIHLKDLGEICFVSKTGTFTLGVGRLKNKGRAKNKQKIPKEGTEWFLVNHLADSHIQETEKQECDKDNGGKKG